MVATALFTFLYFYFDKYVVTFGVNIFNKAIGRPAETKNRTIWEDIFEGTQFLNTQQGFIVMSVEKDGQILSRGMLREFPSPDLECDELILCNCAEIEAFFESDEGKKPENKIFWKTDFEYTILSKGITMKFYNLDKYRQYEKTFKAE